LFVCRTQRGAKDWSATQSVQGQTSIKRYFCYPSFSCVSLYRFERKSMSTLSIFCLRVRVKLFEVIYLSIGRFSYNREFLMGLTTYFFNPQKPLSPRERVSHMPDNLPLQTTIVIFGKARDRLVNYRGSQLPRVQQWWKWLASCLLSA
jgi:hypothetical protein